MCCDNIPHNEKPAGDVLKDFAKFAKNTYAEVSFLIELQAVASNFFKKRLWHGVIL